MASVQERPIRGGSSWRVVFRIGGRQRVKTFEDEESAQAWAKLADAVGAERALAVLTADSRPDDVDTRVRTVRDQIIRHVDRLTGISDGTRQTYTRMADYALGDLSGLPLVTVTKDDAAAWVNGMQAEGLSGKTMRNRHGLVSSAFDMAVADEVIPANPFKGTRLPRTDHESTEMVFLEPDEFARIYQLITGDVRRAFVMFLVGTGARYGEATALTVGDVDLTRGTARIRRAWKHTGKSARQLGPPKSRRSNRTIWFGREVTDAIRPYVEGRDPGDLLFTNRNGRPLGHSSFWGHVWAPAVRRFAGDEVGRRTVGGGRTVECSLREGPGKHPRPHDLRHTFASWAIRSGVPLPVLQRQLGHESITTTIDRYGHLSDTDFVPMRDAINAQLEMPRMEVVPSSVVTRAIG